MKTRSVLVHMNGRAYDPSLGRFLSVDPFVQFPGFSQSQNPYSYILNNPLSGTDPTGYLIGAPASQPWQLLGEAPAEGGGGVTSDPSSRPEGTVPRQSENQTQDSQLSEGISGIDGESEESSGGEKKPKEPLVDRELVEGYESLDSERFPNLFYHPTVEKNETFKNDMDDLVAYYDEVGSTVLSDLNTTAGTANTPVFLSDREQGSSQPTETMKGEIYPTHVTLVVNLRSGLDFGRRGRQSPAVGFLHEAHHTMNFLRDVESNLKAIAQDARGYRRADDKAIINGPEKAFAEKIGQPRRWKHSEGKPVSVRCVSCIE